MNKNNAKISRVMGEIGSLYKILIILTFFIVLITLFFSSFEYRTKEVMKTKIVNLNTNNLETTLDRDKYEILFSDCVNAYIYYPSVYSNEIWLLSTVSDHEDSFCYIRYKSQETKLVFRFIYREKTK